MAFTFNRINGLLGNSNDEKANIFAPGGIDQNLPQNQAPQGNGSGGTVKTDTASDVGSIQSSAPSGGGPSGSGQKQTNQTDILEKNQYQQDPGFTNELKSNISKGQQDLQNEANSYVTAQNAKGDARLSNSDLDSALNGDAAATGTVSSYLNKKDVADPFSSAVNTNYGNLDQLGNSKSLASYLQDRGGQNYNSGMAGLDATLLFRDPGFQKGVSEARAQRDALQAMQQKYSGGDTGLQAQEQSYIDQNLGSGQQAARDYLTQQANAIYNEDPGNLGSLERAAASENATRAADRTAGYANQKDKVQSVIDQIKKEHPDLAQYINVAPDYSSISYRPAGTGDYATDQIDPKSFYHVGGNVTANDLATSSDAARYNAAQNLLGAGGQRLVAGKGASDRESYDTAGLLQALLDKSSVLKGDENKTAQEKADEAAQNAQNQQDKLHSIVSRQADRPFKDIAPNSGFTNQDAKIHAAVDALGGLSNPKTYQVSTGGYSFPGIGGMMGGGGISGGGGGGGGNNPLKEAEDKADPRNWHM